MRPTIAGSDGRTATIRMSRFTSEDVARWEANPNVRMTMRIGVRVTNAANPRSSTSAATEVNWTTHNAHERAGTCPPRYCPGVQYLTPPNTLLP